MYFLMKNGKRKEAITVRSRNYWIKRGWQEVSSSRYFAFRPGKELAEVSLGCM